MLTLQDIKQIQADAEKAVNRQFRDAADDDGWKPTPTPNLDEGTHFIDGKAVEDIQEAEVVATPAKDDSKKAGK